MPHSNKWLLFGLLYCMLQQICIAIQVPTANSQIRSLKEQLSTADAKNKVDLLNEICDEFERIAIDSSLFYAQKGLDISQNISYLEGEIKSLNNIGYHYHEKGKYDQALSYHQKALDYAIEHHNSKYESHCWNFIARVHRSLSNMPMAIDCFLKSLNLRHQLGDSTGIAMVSGNIGYLYWSLNDYENADKYLNQALAIDLMLEDTIYIASDYLNLGLLAQKRGKLDEGIELSEKAMNLFTIKEDWESVAILYGNISLMYSDQGKFQEALDYLDKSFEMKKDINNSRSLTYTYGNYQKIYQDNQQIDKAIEAGEEALEFLKEHPNIEVSQRVLGRLAEAYEKAGKYDKAYTALQEFNTVKDSILDKEKSRQIKQLQTIYETNQKDLTIARQEGELKLANAASAFKSKLTWTISIGLILIFISIFLFRSYRFAIKSKKMEKEFAQQLLLAHEHERKRISQDLHDSVGQSLILIKNKVSLHSDNSTADMVSKALEEVRSISKALHPSTLDKIGLTASIEKQLEELDKHTNIFLSIEIDNIDGLFNKDHELQIYRIFQESINNLMKHSKARSALIKIQNQTSLIRLEITDYGVGFDLTSDIGSLQGLGMKTLRERTQLLNGKILIDSTKGKGTSVILHVNKPTQHV
mgnify:CR=1 FL=1